MDQLYLLTWQAFTPLFHLIFPGAINVVLGCWVSLVIARIICGSLTNLKPEGY